MSQTENLFLIMDKAIHTYWYDYFRLQFYNILYVLLYEMSILCFNKKLFLLLRKTCIFVLLVTFVLKNLLKKFVSVFFSFSYFFPEIQFSYHKILLSMQFIGL